MSASWLTSLLAPGVRSLQPYLPGAAGSLPKAEPCVVGMSLGANENPLGPGRRARAAIRASLAAAGLYPDGTCSALRRALAQHYELPPECITIGNGSNELLVLLAQAFLTPADEALCSQFCFAVYPLAIQLVNAQLRVTPAYPHDAPMPYGHDLRAMREQVNDRTRLVFLANPNNPTGTWFSALELSSFLESLPRTTLVVIDEAYFEYSRDTDCVDACGYLSRFENLIIVRTFSKAYGLAGLRVGYALAHPEVTAALHRIRQPFSVNGIAQAAAAAALEDRTHLRKTRLLNEAGRRQLCSGLGRLGLRTLPSAGNFITVELGEATARVCGELLIRGIRVMPLGRYDLPGFARVTTGTASQNQALLEAIASSEEREAHWRR